MDKQERERLVEAVVAAITKDGKAPIPAAYQRAEAALSAIEANGITLMPTADLMEIRRLVLEVKEENASALRDHIKGDRK